MKTNHKKSEYCQSAHLSRKEFLITGGLFAGCILCRPFNSLSFSAEGCSDVQPWPLRIEGDDLIIPAGNYPSEVQMFEVKKEGRFRIKPVTVKTVINEELFLSGEKPSGFWTGTSLKGPYYDQLGVCQSLIEKSLIIKDGKGTVLRKGDDYLVSAPFALLGLKPNQISLIISLLQST